MEPILLPDVDVSEPFFNCKALGVARFSQRATLLGIIKLEGDNADGVDALFQTNTGGILDFLEKHKLLQEVKNQLEAPKRMRETFVTGLSKSTPEKPNQCSLRKLKEDALYFDKALPLIFSFAGCATKKQNELCQAVMTEAASKKM